MGVIITRTHDMKRVLPPTNLFLAFEAAARHRNFSRAAEELGISQPAVSRAVASLEEAIGVKLFLRSGPSVRLTTRGAELSGLMSNSFDAIEKLIASWKDKESGRKPVLLSISSSMAAHWLIPRLFDFRLAFPDVDLRFELIAGGVGQSPVRADLGLRRFPETAKAPPESHFLDEIIQPVAALDYIKRMGTLDQPRRNRTHTLITLSDHWCDWETFARLAGLELPPNHKTMVFSDYSVALQSALNGQGIVLGWLSVTSRLLRYRSLLAASDRGFNTRATFNFILGDQTPVRGVVGEVREWLCAEVGKDVAKIGKGGRLHSFECHVLVS
ncbi:LysR family transcriptional regulator [Azospirillum brasilense]|nr:LysR family transcriptional regulator [Azospirillum brasilense]